MNKRTLRIAGLLAAISALFWMTTGMGWWSPLLNPNENGWEATRGFLIAVTHFGVMVAAALSYHP